MAANQPRRRPLAGQRSRSRLEPGGAPAATTPVTPPVPVGPAEQAPTADARPRRTAVLDRARTAAARPADAAADRGTTDRAPAARRTSDLLVLVAGVVVLALVLTAGALMVKRSRRGPHRAGADRGGGGRREPHRRPPRYDYRHLDRDFARAERGLTGGFAKDYATTTETAVRPTAEEVQAVVKAEVASSSVVRAAQNTVVVLLFVNQTTTSTRVDGPQVDLNRVRMTLTRVGEDWKISAVTAL